MTKSKVILLLKTFSSDEIKSFNDFLNSPYFNKNKTVCSLFSILKNLYPEFNEVKTDKGILYKKLFTGKEYNEQVMKNLISGLYKLCREFLETESFRKDKHERKLNLLKQLIPRNADQVYSGEVKNFEKELGDLSELSEKSFYYLFQLEELKISFHLERNQQPKVFEKVMNSGEFLLLYFHLHLTKTISNLNVNKQTFNVEYKTNAPDQYFKNTDYKKFISYLEKNEINFSEIFKLYYLRVMCNTDPFEESDYFEFKKLLLRNLNSLGRVEIYGLFNAAAAYCIRKIHSQNEKFIKELFDISKTEIENGFYKFSENSPVTIMKFRNTCLPALRLKEFEWVKNFVEEYKNDIIESDRENAVKIIYAQMSFEKGEYEEVLGLLSGLNPDQLYLKLDIRNLTLMSYIELDYTESALSMIDSFRHYLSGNKSLSDAIIESNLRFVNSVNSYILMKERVQTEKLSDLKNSLAPYINEMRINWLIEKINKEMK
ncbi:MAG: hypothetical protein JSS91_13460 [Bacteroidetes bacterium]|nr:hypothetical protein [Bacteroidota bacterium]